MTETEPAIAVEPTIKELVAQWEELRKQFPPPTQDEVMAEWKWIHGLMADPSGDLGKRYGGQWVVVYQQQIVASGLDPLQLEVFTARKLGLHPERLVITRINGEWPGPNW